MDKITRLTKEIELYSKELQQIEQRIEELKKKKKSNNEAIAEAYKEFYDSKTSKEFILYERFPSVQALEIYISRNRLFPLYNFGELNAKELAEIIKHIYQFKTGEEHKILTLGVSEMNCDPVYGGECFWVKPHLYFMIGNEKTLSPFEQYDGQFVNDNKLHSHVYLYAKGKGLINIELDREWIDSRTMNIQCFTGEQFDQPGMINYYDIAKPQYDVFNVSPYKNVFSYHIRTKLNSSSSSGIKDVFDFNIHHMDTYIAKILISIIIYKRNNNIKELCEDDYNHIFGVLFGEKVDILGDVEKDFVKNMIYVPNKQVGR